MIISGYHIQYISTNKKHQYLCGSLSNFIATVSLYARMFDFIGGSGLIDNNMVDMSCMVKNMQLADFSLSFFFNKTCSMYLNYDNRRNTLENTMKSIVIM